MNTVRLLNLMIVAVKAIKAMKKEGGEDEFRFFLNLLGLQSVPTSTPAKPAIQKVAKFAADTMVVLPGTILPSAKPAMPMPAERPARVMAGTAPVAPKLRHEPPLSNDFATKINGAAVKLGMEDHSIIGKYRRVLADLGGKGIEYWNLCREVTEDALRGTDLSDSDWDLLVEKMKFNLFFTGKKAELFIECCPKEKLANLLLDQDGLTGLVAQIRAEEHENKSSAYRISFILDACVKVGHDAKILRVNCVHAVNRMKQLNFIGPDHWLVKKVADMKAVRTAIPASSQPPVPAPVEVLVEAPVSEVPSVQVETAGSVEPTDDNGGKPPFDLEFETEFAQLMGQEEASQIASAIVN